MENINLVLRFNNAGLARFTRDPIGDHVKVLKANKTVFFGKLGKPISATTLTQIDFQIKQQIPTFLYLLTKKQKATHYSCFKCRLLSASSATPEKLTVPSYYGNIEGEFGTWFELASIDQCDHKVLDDLKLASSGKIVSDALKSMSALFVVSN